VPPASSGYNIIQIFKGERKKEDNYSNVIKESKGSNEFTDLFC
jgi:hypothetical protein